MFHHHKNHLILKPTIMSRVLKHLHPLLTQKLVCLVAFRIPIQEAREQAVASVIKEKDLALGIIKDQVVAVILTMEEYQETGTKRVHQVHLIALYREHL